MTALFDLFAICAPGLETYLADEMHDLGFVPGEITPGGVAFQGGWPEIWRANLELRGATRVLLRMASFRAMHVAQLDKRSRKVDWAAFLRPDVPVKVEATCRASRIYHAGAARQRVARAITETLGAPVTEDAELVVKVRIADDLVTISVDTSGEPLHRRGYKEWTGKAPMRETMASSILRACGYTGTEPVLDPMCGSGTFVLEAAAIAAGHQPGAERSFVFESLAGYNAVSVAALRRAWNAPESSVRFVGSDRDAGAIRGATANAARAHLAGVTEFLARPVSEIVPPDGPPGLVIANPPYGARIGNRRPLFALHASLGAVLRERFAGWRVGIVTSDGGLAKATELPLTVGPDIAHGGLRVRLYQARIS
ncbi:THUMP domain-containing class I SAM-dependent RNA methyltransferase [Palleronia caenipelagi]|uniref:Class I SAM-dependent RNA methyltransferase n=1 Tax=Palleronia caenipelagi TaxID=2489174 RepID=A0A547Q2S2_9RHOB|nr:class I SAM-dependent RNA methyltransferase [Palleronia caenipelagi]TRD20682.1 class I SAM-dependent RNA methyltransferase [Palleronia caenipelagi]